MLLCIEMAIFSVLHLFAFSWKEYTTNKDGMDPHGGYKGGPLGVKAIIDAFNVWDLIKAAARGFRWLFVGRRKRTTDRSYNPAPTGSDHLTGLDTTYHGSAHGGYGEPASKPDDSQSALIAEERHELLRHSQQPPVSPLDPDSLPIKNPEPGTTDGFSEPPRQTAVYPAARQHDHKPTQTPPYPDNQSYDPRPKPNNRTPYPDDSETPPTASRFSFDNEPERLNDPGVPTTGPGRRQSPPRQYHQEEPWSPLQQPPYHPR
jgi:hypothetical protein